MVFLLATWVVGKLAVKVKIPSLVGEMVVGMVLGPELLNVVPFPLALTLVGEVGLLLLVLEAGLEVDLAMLKQIGGKGLVVAAVGSATRLVKCTRSRPSPRSSTVSGCSFVPHPLGNFFW